MANKTDKKIETNEPDITRANVFVHAEIKEVKVDEFSDDDFVIEGYASTEHMDRYRDITHADAFSKTIKDYMSKNPIVLYMHNMGDPIGRVLEATIEKGKGLFVRVAVSKTAEKARTLIREKILKAFSFGFYVVKSEDDNSDKTKKPVRHLREVDLLEISIVSIGANQNALFSLAKALEFGSDLFYTADYGKHLEKCINELSEKQTELEQTVKILTVSIDTDRLNEELLKASKVSNGDFVVRNYAREELYRISANKIMDDGSIKITPELIHELILNSFELKEIKAGKVLSAKNRSAVQTAVDALLKVLEVDAPPTSNDDDKSKSIKGGDENKTEKTNLKQKLVVVEI